MARNLQLALTLLAKDTASKILKKLMQDTVKQTKASEKAGDELAKSQQQNASTGIKASRSLQDEYRRAASARATVGIRSERDIQREILQTQAAYSRLVRTGTLSVNEQTRAFRAMKSQVRELNIEMRGFSRLERAKGWGSNTMAIAGGVTAAGAVIADPVKRQMEFDSRNAEIANTAYSELPATERIKKIPLINSTIREAVRYGGGTPESAQETLNALFAGGLDDKTALKILPDITRYASASGASPQDLANIGIAAIKNFGIPLNELPAVYDKSIRSGEDGKYELSDMAQSLALTLSKANSVGMSGLDDLDRVLAMLQANAETAGDNAAASTNVNNLFDKYSSADTQNALKKYRFRGKDGKTLGYTDYMADQRLQGVSASDAFTNVVSGIVSADKRVQRLRSEAKKYKGTDREKDILASLDLVVSSITSKIIADQQASTALKTSILKKDFIQERIKGTKNAVGAGAASFDVMASRNKYKSEQFESEKLFAEQDSVKPLADTYGDLASKLADYAKEYPELTVAISGATTGIKAMTAAAMVFAGIRFLGGAGGMGGVAGPKGPISIPGMSGAGGIGLSVAALSITAGSVAIKTTQDYLRQEFAQKSMPEKVESLKSGTSGYSFVDVAWEVIKNRLSGNSKPSGGISMPSVNHDGDINPFPAMEKNIQNYGVPAYLQKPANGNGQPTQPIQLNTKIELDGRVLAESVNTYNGNQSSRGPMGVPQ
ncbi:phage tail tape measure protein [Obesumbacterium proteus]|mgnify:CR=1 FL=1|uniref:phage tail tape measure protein n=1 Tax=Obesumbacterium proteus TaxID=82983 RepID=UPI002431A97F|nr:phage tail tape measure protein [Obesumbacterium proteus]